MIVFANEKGGTGKSTTAVHTAVALAAAGREVAVLDLDTRQRTTTRYLENRESSANRLDCALPTPRFMVHEADNLVGFERSIEALAEDSEFLIIDTPGRDDPLARISAARADTLVTPINDSFVDLDLIGEVDPEDYTVRKPSFYAELVWEARKAKAQTGGEVDWVVLRNRLQHIGARNMLRVADALRDLSRRVGFRVIPGLSERVIYRELFPSGLTLLDIDHFESVGMSHVAARQELREMVAALQLPEKGVTQEMFETV
ncbi:division plane positioning ATPase MipZ [Parasphingopyxis sp. CP4]|uniref:division plane positioning ATPase MipZ n=1 Tax=Parasphingopyxis sp. CP4 TaxID=2724527 RepID=UPI0015A33073|nr:division plane positioning ATPase MipZ [Parasphingopyxis sp. CP4]